MPSTGHIERSADTYAAGYSAGFEDACAIGRTIHKQHLDRIRELEESVSDLVEEIESYNHDLPY